MRKAWQMVKIAGGAFVIALTVVVLTAYEYQGLGHAVGYLAVATLMALCAIALVWDGFKKLRLGK